MVGVTKPGTRVPMEVWRKGKVVTLSVKVGELKEPKAGSSSQESPEPAANPLNALGLKVTEVSQAVRTKEKIKGGVQVTEVADPAAPSGINVGDVILTVDRKSVV